MPPRYYKLLYHKIIKKELTNYLNSFRGQPAISKFDWSFATTHRSSPYFATHWGSDYNILPMVRSHGFGFILVNIMPKLTPTIKLPLYYSYFLVAFFTRKLFF
jgi:hypothetical protein